MILELIESIKEHEGFRGDVYQDSLGYDTVGYGTLMPIDKHEATMLLKSRLENMIKELNQKKPILKVTPEKIRLVLYEMVYQLGVNRLLGFKKMWKAVEDENWPRMAVEMKDSRWYNQTTNRAEALIKRVLT